MKRILFLAFALVFIAASCNFLTGSTGSMGVFRSDDFGSSFHESNSIDKKTNLSQVSVNSLVFEPGNTQNVYLAASGGLYKSQDAASSWKLILTNIAVADVAIDPTNTGTIYAVGSSDGHGKIVGTTDNAASWKDLYTEPTSGNSVLSIALDPADHLHVWAGLSAGEVIQSRDGGTTWQLIDDLHDRVYRLRYGPNGHLYALTVSNGLYEIKDSSGKFAKLTETLTSGFVNVNSNFSSVSRFLDLAFDFRQNGVLYLATDAGLVRTVNDGASWSYMSMPVRNALLRTSSVAVNPSDSNNLYAVVGTTMFISNNGGVTWETKPLPTGQEVRQILIDGNSPNVIYLGLGVKK